MDIFNICLMGLVLFDTLLLAAIAASLSKLIESKKSQEQEEKVETEAVSIGPPTYDMNVFTGKIAPYTDGLERRLSPTKNWDGISQEE